MKVGVVYPNSIYISIFYLFIFDELLEFSGETKHTENDTKT